MNHGIKALGLAAACMLASSAFAATYYLSDCKAGASPACVPGTAANDGLSPATPKQLWSQLPLRRGGDTILFAKGGSWTDASMGIYIPTASTATPVTWDSYTPPWAGTAKPILTESRKDRYLFNFDDGGQKQPDGGYVIRNLDLRGGGVMGGPSAGGAAVFAYWGVNDLLMENLEISGFRNGVYTAHLPKRADGWENYRVTLRNSYLHDNLASSFLGGAADLVIENNILDRNGSVPIFDHDIYISSVARGVIRNNTITRSVLDAAGKCTGSVIVVHGAVDGLQIENNRIVQPPGGNMPTCFGIEVSGGYADAQGSEYFHDVVIRGNTVVDVGYIGIGARGCTRCLIENNTIVWTGGGGNQGISMGVNNPSSLDERGTALTIRNNSIYMQATSGTPTGILLVNEGTNHAVSSNVIYFGSAAIASARCFDTKTYGSGDFRAFDNNLCFRAGGATLYSPAHATLSAAKAAGFDVHGLDVDPQFVAVPSAANGYSLAVRGDSPASAIGISGSIDRTPPAPPVGFVAR
jgi:hypothetical protein